MLCNIYLPQMFDSAITVTQEEDAICIEVCLCVCVHIHACIHACRLHQLSNAHMSVCALKLGGGGGGQRAYYGEHGQYSLIILP